MSDCTVFLPAAACAGVVPELQVQRVMDGVRQQMSFVEACAQLSTDWCLVLPVEAVTACALTLPTRKARWLRQALPFAVEELLAEDVEQMHLALGEPLADGRHRVFALRRQWLADWLALCTHPPFTIALDADLLPVSGVSVLLSPSRCLLGGELAARMAFNLPDWPQIQNLYSAPAQLFVEPDASTKHELSATQEVADAYVWLAQQPVRNNLAQAEFALQNNQQQWQRWRSVAGLVGLWVVLQWGFNLTQAWHLQRQADTYAQANSELYQRLFPQDHKLVNVRAQFDQHLREVSAAVQSPLFSSLAGVAEVVQGQAIAVQVDQLDYSEERGDLALQVIADDFSALEQFREQLQVAGMAVHMGSASRDGAQVSARVVIGE